MQRGVNYVGVAVVYFCHDGKGNVLFNKRGKNCRDEHGVWDIGGGGVEFGDTIFHTLQKEIAEEYCTEILESEFLGHQEIIDEHMGKNRHYITFDFKVLVDRKKAKNGEPHKFDAVEWFTLKNLPNPLHSQIPNFLEKYKDKLTEFL